MTGAQFHVCQTSLSSSLDSIPNSAINVGSIIHELRSFDEGIQLDTQGKKKSDSWKIAVLHSTPVSNSRRQTVSGSNVSPALKTPPSLRRDRRQVSRITETQDPTINGESSIMHPEQASGLLTPSKYDTAYNASRRRADRRESAASDDPFVRDEIEEMKNTPRQLAYDSSSFGGMIRERRGDWKPKFPERMSSWNFMGKLRSVAPPDSNIRQTTENTAKEGLARTEKSGGSGMQRLPDRTSSRIFAGSLDPITPLQQEFHQAIDDTRSKGPIASYSSWGTTYSNAGRPDPQELAGCLDPAGSPPRYHHKATEETDTRDSPSEDKTSESGLAQERNETSQNTLSDRPTKQPRGTIESRSLPSGECDVSDAVKDSRRRREERRAKSSNAVLFTDRYRNEERKKAWNGTKPCRGCNETQGNSGEKLQRLIILRGGALYEWK